MILGVIQLSKSDVERNENTCATKQLVTFLSILLLGIIYGVMSVKIMSYVILKLEIHKCQFTKFKFLLGCGAFLNLYRGHPNRQTGQPSYFFNLLEHPKHIIPSESVEFFIHYNTFFFITYFVYFASS